MCGRYQTPKEAKEIEKILNVRIDKKIYKVNYNAYPSQQLPLISNSKPDEVQYFKWGLIPHWASYNKINYRMFNAKIETLREKVSYKNLVDKKRCLVITNGYYEWKERDSRNKQPYRICLKDESLFLYAGLWTEWIDPDGVVIPSFTIITTGAIKSLADIHDRMPVMLNSEVAKAWLLNEIEIEHLQQEVIKSNDIMFYPISKLVNDPENNTPELLDKIF